MTRSTLTVTARWCWLGRRGLLGKFVCVCLMRGGLPTRWFIDFEAAP
jgi:hypothetical protein